MTTNLALNSNWLNTTATATLLNETNAGVFTIANSGWCHRDYWYPWYEPLERHIHHHNTTVAARPVKLTMSEVERLRVAAKKDKDLQKTLAKFTDLIEVVVDFE